ncbi:MAG: ABC transporter ATP-binding protein [archaeon]|nr:ABC transporter ATP-binding protein [archaeon]
MIDVTDACVSIGKKRIVNTASLHVDEGELVGLIGPNGSGKSTLLKAVYRTLGLEGGVIEIGGTSIDNMSLRESAQRLAVVSQHNYYNFDFVVEEVVMMGRTPHKRSMEMDSDADRQVAYKALDRVNMLHMKDRKFSSLSGGEQQRIILAKALTQETPCLVLDEPTNHLDVKYQLEVLDIVKSLGVTVLCALHDLNLAAQYCDRIYLLYNGQIAAEGTPEEVITEENIRRYYGVKASVETHPKTGLLNVVYYPKHVGGEQYN